MSERFRLDLDSPEGIGRLAAAQMTIATAPELAARSLARYQYEVERLREALAARAKGQP